MTRKLRLDPLAGSAADKLIDAAVDIRQNPDDYERSYMARQLVQCTLPHSDPGDVSVWTRTNGHLRDTGFLRSRADAVLLMQLVHDASRAFE